MELKVRCLAKLYKGKFGTSIINSVLYSEEKPISSSEFFDHSVLMSLADKLAPVKRVIICSVNATPSSHHVSRRLVLNKVT